MPSRATRFARYGTVYRPMNPAASREMEAATAVARRFPFSRKTVEKSAEVNASARPKMAMKKRIHAERSIFASADCSVVSTLNGTSGKRSMASGLASGREKKLQDSAVEFCGKFLV